MKCKKCGSPTARYVESRKKFWRGRAGGEHGRFESRTDFRVKCHKCGAEYENN